MNLRLLFWLWVAIAGIAQFSAQTAIAAPSFRLKIERFERRPVTAEDIAQGYHSQIVVVLGGEGTAPAWWSEHSVYSSSLLWGVAKLVYQGKGTGRPVPIGPSYRDEVASWTPVWNPITRQHEARYLFKLSDLPSSKEEVVLRGTISLSDFSRSQIKSDSPENSSVSFSYGVRSSGQIIAPPQVSRDPKVDVTRIKIQKLAEPQFDGIGEYKHDTIVRIFYRDRNASAPTYQLLPGYPRLVDEKGGQIPQKFNWFPLVGTDDANSSQTAFHFSFLLRAIPMTQRYIFLETTWSPHQDWPLHFLIPLRRNGRDGKRRTYSIAIQRHAGQGTLALSGNMISL